MTSIEADEDSARGDLVGLGLAAATSAVWVSVLGVVIPGVFAVGAWMFTPHDYISSGDLSSTLRLTAMLWAVAHLAPVVTPAGLLSLFPLGLALLPLVLLWRGGRRAAKAADPADFREALILTSGFALAHAIFVLLVGALGSTDSMRIRPLVTAGQAGLIAFVVVGVAVLHQCELLDDVRDVIPAVVRVGVTSAVMSLLALTAASTLVFAAAIVLRRQDIAAVSTSLGSSITAQISLVLLSVLYAPTILGWLMAASTGAGVHVGGGAVLGLGVGAPGALPPFPLLAVLPERVPEWTRVLPLVVVLSVMAGSLLARRRFTARSWRDLLTLSVIVALTFTALLSAVAVVTSGSLGERALADLGPHARIAAGFALVESVAAVLAVLVVPRLIAEVAQRRRTALPH